MVKDWFSKNRKGWNEELVKELVSEDKVDKICPSVYVQLPLKIYLLG